MHDIVPMAGKNLNDIVIARVLGEIRAQQSRKVTILDLGSGQGYNADRLAAALTAENADFSITCVDINNAQFKISNEPGIRFVQHDLNEDLALGAFDFVIGTEIIEHVENPYHFMRTVTAHLSQKGVAYITTPNPEHVFSLIKECFLGRPMWFSVDEPSGHIMPIHYFMMEEALRRINRDQGMHYRIDRSFNRNCFPMGVKNGRLHLATIPGNNRAFGEINIFRISS